MSQDTRRLARAVHTLEVRRRSTTDVHNLVNGLRGSLIVIDGEVAMLEQLDARLTECEVALQFLASDAPEPEAEIAAMEHALYDPSWELLEFLQATLTEKRLQQLAFHDSLERQLNERCQQLRSLRAATERARSVFAAIRDDEKQLRMLEDIEKQARRAFTEAQHDRFERQIRDFDGRNVAKLVADLERRIKDAPAHWRHLELLLIRTQDEQTYHRYSIVLRTPGDAGAHGLSIHDSSTLTELDRQSFLKSATDIERGLHVHREREQVTGLRELQSSGSAIEPGMTPPANLEDLARALGDEMFRLVLPVRMQDYVRAMNCSMTITTNDLELPWELMSLQDTEPMWRMCLERPVARMPMATRLPRERRTRAPAALSKKLRLLLIGSNARGTLPAVTREIERIAGALRTEFENGIDIDTPPQATSRMFSDALTSGKYDVIHYAGHALFNPAQPHLSSLQLDDDKFLAEKVVKLTTGNPVVFLNACGTGATSGEFARIGDARIAESTEGLASAFMEAGALGCIGNLWSVHDEAAADFAIDFYKHLIQGHTIGKSMLDARHTVHNMHPARITWASFVLFGNPLFRLNWSA
jgi:hypothetical protein